MDKIAQDNNIISSWQQYLAQGPLGVVYQGPQDGKLNEQLKNKLNELERKLQFSTSQAFIGKLIQGDNILQPPNYINKYITDISVTPTEQGAGVKKPQQNPEQARLVIEWKKYLRGKGVYTGDVNDPMPDEQFVSILQQVEVQLSKALSQVKGAPANSASGMIWTGKRVNPETSPADLEAAMDLLNRWAMSKSGQATVDTWQKPDSDNPVPTALNWHNNPIGYESPNDNTEIPHPADNQRQGIMDQKVPAEDIDPLDLDEETDPDSEVDATPESTIPAVGMNMDDRVLELLKISKNI